MGQWRPLSERSPARAPVSACRGPAVIVTNPRAGTRRWRRSRARCDYTTRPRLSRPPATSRSRRAGRGDGARLPLAEASAAAIPRLRRTRRAALLHGDTLQGLGIPLAGFVEEFIGDVITGTPRATSRSWRGGRRWQAPRASSLPRRTRCACATSRCRLTLPLWILSVRMVLTTGQAARVGERAPARSRRRRAPRRRPRNEGGRGARLRREAPNWLRRHRDGAAGPGRACVPPAPDATITVVGRWASVRRGQGVADAL